MPVRRAQPPTPAEPVTTVNQFVDQALLFLSTHWWWIAIGLVLLALTFWGLRRLKKKHTEIQKLWVFTLFFLTKRQMMIPLVIALSSKDKILDQATRKKLMEIRGRCREVSFKKSPIARLKLETEVSEILFKYFSRIEKNGQLKSNTRFYKIVQDLEFIDAKLVQLQKVYNLETQKWNQGLKLPGLKLLLKPFGIGTFESFN